MPEKVELESEKAKEKFTAEGGRTSRRQLDPLNHFTASLYAGITRLSCKNDVAPGLFLTFETSLEGITLRLQYNFLTTLKFSGEVDSTRAAVFVTFL